MQKRIPGSLLLMNFYFPFDSVFENPLILSFRTMAVEFWKEDHHLHIVKGQTVSFQSWETLVEGLDIKKNINDSETTGINEGPSPSPKESFEDTEGKARKIGIM